MFRRVGTSVALRAAVSLVLLAIVALQIDWPAAAARLAQGQWPWFAAAVGLLGLALIVGALRWHGLLAGVGVRVPGSRALRAYAIGTFANNFLPTSFGGDAVRAWLVGRSGPPLVRSLASVFVDRASALACLLGVGWTAVAIPGAAAVPASLVSALAVLTAVGAGAIGLLALALRARGVGARLPVGLARAAREARDALVAYRGQRRLAVQALALGVVFQALTVTATWMIARALELAVPLAVVAVAVPLVLAASLVPISIAGFGVREGGFVLVLAQVGVPATEAALLSLLSVAALALSSLPGALAMLSGSGGTYPWRHAPSPRDRDRGSLRRGK